ncbi:UDP-3-O-(3-hydroxymyristoyl)glucosamine N-acyltransferase [bacterium]|nr:UDP-3-O-(3-hydroxymyristoyl)glucosamine N-acyltransferase [bacterium]
MEATVGALAERLNGRVVGNVETTVTGLAPLSDSVPGDLTFLGEDTKLRELANCSAAAVLISTARESELSDSQRESLTLIVVDDAQDAFLSLLAETRPQRSRPDFGCSPAAVIAESASIGTGTNVFPTAVIGDDVVIGENCDIHPGVVIGAGCRIGDGVTLHPRVVLYSDVEIGNRVILHAGAVIGADGFGYRFRNGRFEKVPQLGTVRIEDDVEVGANATIDRAAIDATVVGQGTKIDNLVMVAHNCQIGKHNAFASQVGIAGSCSTGDYVRAGGQVGVGDHINIGTGASLAAGSGFHKDVPAGETWAGYPARPMEEASRVLMVQNKLPEMRSTVKSLEKQVAQLTEQLDELKSHATADAA